MFNPDEYVNENNVVIKSCFDFNQKLGLTTIPEESIEPWNNRLMILKNTINNYMTYDVHSEPIKIIKLFYDDEQALENNKVVLKVVKNVKNVKDVKNDKNVKTDKTVKDTKDNKDSKDKPSNADKVLERIYELIILLLLALLIVLMCEAIVRIAKN
jgi:hypothetical protein